MDFKEYMEYRADEDCDVGVIAFDLRNDKCVPFGSNDEIIFFYVEGILAKKDELKYWRELKTELP